VFRLAKWKIKYDFIRDGTSYTRMMNAIEYEAPVILTITDFGKKMNICNTNRQQ
jgi:hypothetical protein